MKTDLLTAIIAAVVGAVAAFAVTNIFLPELESVSFKILSNGTDYSTLSSPDEEIFNYRALNPTVEVYVGNCDVYDENGECADNTTTEEEEEANVDGGDESDGGETGGGDNGADEESGDGTSN